MVANKIPQNFTSPPLYHIYGGPTGEVRHITGQRSLMDCEDFIFAHRKSYPAWTYHVWKVEGEWVKVTTDA